MAFLLGNPRKSRNHGRLARARDPLHGDDAVAGREAEHGSGHLSGVELLVAGDGIDPLDGGVGCDDGSCSPPPLVDLGEDQGFGGEGLRRGDMGERAIDPVRLAGDEFSALQQLVDARVGFLGRDPLEAEIERGLGDLRDREGRFALFEDSDC